MPSVDVFSLQNIGHQIHNTTQHKIKQNQRTMITSSSCWMRSTRTQHRIITFCSEINKRENEVSREVHKPTLNISLLLFLPRRRHQSTAQPFINHLTEMNFNRFHNLSEMKNLTKRTKLQNPRKGRNCRSQLRKSILIKSLSLADQF